MFEHKMLENLNQYFNTLSARNKGEVYFYRIAGYNEGIKNFIKKYYEAARRSGVVIEGRISNPNENNLSYYEEIMGMDFLLDMGFLISSLQKWLPRMNDYQRKNVATSIYDTLEQMRQEGKNDSMLRNAYIKFMCWLYYKFERIVNQLGNDEIPKILYEGEISNYELKMLTILSNAGCDIVFLQIHGEEAYKKLDSESKYSILYEKEEMLPFPKEFSIATIRNEIEQERKNRQLYGILPDVMNATNIWIEGNGFEDILKEIQLRGTDPNLFYNCFYRMNGVEDKLTYLNELYQFQLQLKTNGRRIVIVENSISCPTIDEIQKIRRNSYTTPEQMILDLSHNIQYSANIQLQRVMIKAFVDLILEESRNPDNNLNKLTNKAVYLLCWLQRYQPELFSNWNMPDISCFIYFGSCKNETEALFLRFLARLPIDVVILNPNLNTKCCLTDKLLFEKNYDNSLVIEKFPSENSDVHMTTVAYQAERELDTMMYQGSGLYRNQQYTKAVSVSLQTIYEEINILWNQELKYRPNFSVIDNVVNLPVIFAKVSGVKNGSAMEYWSEIKALFNEDTIVVKDVPFINSTDANPIKAHATEFFKNGRLNKTKIKEHPCYQYSFLRDEMQEYMLDKLALLIEQRTIKGTFENGTEYTIISTVLNLKKEMIRMIQKFDFTKKNPKLIYINTTEKIISLEDSIMTAFLNLIGFDIVFFVPTGYQNVEKYFNRKVLEEYQIGEYLYDLHTPNFDLIPLHPRRSWRDKIFKRG